MPYKLLLTLFISTMLFSFPGLAQVSVEKFGALPDDTLNDREAIQKAIDYCKKNRVKQLRFPPGRYIIREEKAIQLMNDVMDGKMGRNPQDIVYTPYYPYTRGIHINGFSELEIRADGAFFAVQGWMEPISIENSRQVSIQGLTIDYDTPPHSEGLVVRQEADYFDLQFQKAFPIRNNMVMLRIMFWDLTKNRLQGKSLYFPKKNELLNDSTIRIWASTPEPVTGTMALINHMFHFRPAVLLNESADIHLKQLTIHAQPGMGIVGHRTENITMDGLRIVPAPGRYQSTNTDATHFTSCKGLIRFNGCSFEGQGDDATNVHGYYQVITAADAGQRYTIQMEKQWGTHAMVLDYPDAGDELELVAKETLEVVGYYKVTKTIPRPKEWCTIIELDKKIAGPINHYYLINRTRIPRLEFVNSYVGSHLARAVLVKTRNVLIENNTFRESTGTAIHIGAEGDWREGPGSANVHIRNNRILRCGRGDGTNDDATAIAINVKAPAATVAGIHRQILIEGNLIEGDSSITGISISGATDVQVRNNVFSGCKNPIVHKFSTGLRFSNNYDGTKPIPSFSY